MGLNIVDINVIQRLQMFLFLSRFTFLSFFIFLKRFFYIYGVTGTEFHRAARAPGRITSRGAPPYEELDLRHEFLHLFSGKSTKTAATRAALFDSMAAVSYTHLTLPTILRV